MERRVLRRAADQALLTSLAQLPDTAAQPGGPADRDFKYKRPVAVDAGETYDPEPTTEPIPVIAVDDAAPPPVDDGPQADIVEEPAERADVYDLVPENVEDHGPIVAAQPDDHRWGESADVPTPPVDPRPLRASPFAAPYVAPHLDFARVEHDRWYRTKPAAA